MDDLFIKIKTIRFYQNYCKSSICIIPYYAIHTQQILNKMLKYSVVETYILGSTQKMHVNVE